MKKFVGDYDMLRQIVSTVDIPGDWRELPNGQKQFRTIDGAVLNWWESSKTLQVQGRGESKIMIEERIAEAMERDGVSFNRRPNYEGNGKQRDQLPNPTTVFVVHGHDTDSRDQLELVIHRLGLKPFILQNTSSGSATIIEALESQIGKEPAADFGIVLMTPDDQGFSNEEGSTRAKPRARQNVILEMGMLLASLTRRKVAILVKGDVEHPSDIHGIIYLRFEKHIKEVVPALCEHLRMAGFDIANNAITSASRG